MTTIEAQKIIEDFHKSIKDLRPSSIVQSNKELPYTNARIKYAHFVYAEYLIKEGFYIKGKTKEEISQSFEKKYQELMESYGIIDSFFIEDAESTNAKYRDYLKGLNNKLVTDFLMPNPFGETGPVNEFHNFLGECWFLHHRTNLFTDNPLGAFIYEAMRVKAIKEKDIKLLVEIVNTAKTRSVIFPGRKNNEESIFIKI